MNITRKQIISWLGISLLVLLAWYLRSVFAYFLVAVVLSFIGAPIMRFLDSRKLPGNKKIPRSISALLVILTFVTVIASFLYVVLPPLAEQISSVSSISTDQLNTSFAEPLSDFRKWCASVGLNTELYTVDYFKNEFKSLLNIDNLGALAGNLVSGASSLVGWVFIVLFVTFFLLKEKYLFYRLLHLFTPVNYEDKMQSIVRNLNYMLGRYFRSLLLQILVFGTYIFVGLSIFGEKYALTVALFSGLVNLISYVGPLIGVSFALIFSVLSHIGGSFYGVILPEMYQVILVYSVAVFLDNVVSYPIIFSQSLKVHPLELFFVILSGAQLGGLGGMMLAAPLYTVIRIFAKELLANSEVVQNITRKI